MGLGSDPESDSPVNNRHNRRFFTLAELEEIKGAQLEMGLESDLGV